MKPKERYLNYALLSTANCEPNQSPFKEDIPIDLSTKRSPPGGHNFGLFKSFEQHPPFQSPPHGNEWTSSKYCFPNLMAKQYGYPPTIFPYLFINPNCLPGHEIERKHEDPLYEPFGLPYRLPQDGLLFPFKLDPYAHHLYARHQADRQSDGDRAALSSESSSSSVPSSPYDHEFHHLQQLHEQHEAMRRSQRPSARPTQETTVSPSIKGSQMVRSSSNSSGSRCKLRKSLSQPNLSGVPPRPSSISNGTSSLRRTKSEHNLHLIQSYSSPSKICAPKKLFASNYYQNMKENAKECKENSISNKDGSFSRSNNGTPTRFYRNYRKEVIESWDNENKGIERVQADDALDLRMNTPLHKLPNGLDKLSPGYEKTNGCMADCNEASKLELKHPVALPLDIYRQYYYYLIQEPAFASRAAVAVAETYAKFLHSNAAEEKHNNGQQQQHFSKSASSSPVDKFDNGGAAYETKRASPDFILSGSRAELRSADTTNCSLPFDRKRISRPLTGKHVRHGTGASPSTLVSLRNMIQQRQKLKENGKFDANSRYGKGKAKRFKRK